MLAEIAATAFGDFSVNLGPTGLPLLVPAPSARAAAALTGRLQVGVFGKEGFEGELNLPPGREGGASYKVDFTLVLVDSAGDVKAFVPVEVQSIDTTGSTGNARAALLAGRTIEADTVGLNWENVSKRIIPQLVFKGLMLQGERLCDKGMYFVTPEAVFRRVMTRLGNQSLTRLRQIPPQPGSITFVRYEHDGDGAEPGATVPLRVLEPITISTSDMSLAFISPENLPGSGSYEQKIRARL